LLEIAQAIQEYGPEHVFDIIRPMCKVIYLEGGGAMWQAALELVGEDALRQAGCHPETNHLQHTPKQSELNQIWKIQKMEDR
jgi:hypothetical protein